MCPAGYANIQYKLMRGRKKDNAHRARGSVQCKDSMEQSTTNDCTAFAHM